MYFFASNSFFSFNFQSGSEDMASADDLLNCIINSPSGSDSSGSDSLFQSNGFNTSEELLSYALLNSPASSDTSADSLLSPSMFDIENLTMSVNGSSVNCENTDASFPMDFGKSHWWLGRVGKLEIQLYFVNQKLLLRFRLVKKLQFFFQTGHLRSKQLTSVFWMKTP